MPSPLQSASEKELLVKFICTKDHDVGFMIRDLPPAQPSDIRRESFPSSLGLLDTLPAELLFLTLNLLDFQSLSRLSRVSFKGKAVVENLAPYTDMMKHAPTALAALGRTRLLHLHPATLLRQVLRSDKCVSCFGFGAFLFLPTCERVCFACLYENLSLHMTTTDLAKQCFNLTERQLQRVPIMHSIPGTYGMRRGVSRKRVYRLVNIKQVKRLAIDVHGSVDNLPELDMPEGDFAGPAFKRFYVFMCFREAPLNPPGRDMSRLPERSSLVEDDFYGMASIRFPYLNDVGVDYGIFCKGCHVIYKTWDRQRSLPAGVLSDLVPPGESPGRSLRAQASILRSTRGFLEHVKNCHGVRWLLAKSAEH
ncbi:hypothetical protein F4778DRAFT_761618 [Xylariomycetidae sp. FL2044]|nr:hypothetical protein F4778DRAFT_761618 [Xylariomycetidae sp. FL2044]